MATPDRAGEDFGSRLKGPEVLIGTFVKTPGPAVPEILGSIGFDFIVIDEEHAPLNRETIDVMILAARYRGVAPIVRVGDPSAFSILGQLDAGAAGVMIPHVDSPAKAAEMAAACRYRGGRRGFGKSARAGDYGAVANADHIDRQDATVLCIPMIEDPEGVECAAEIIATPGVDAVFIGRGDLSVAYGVTSTADARIVAAAERITAAARAAGKPAMALATGPQDQRWLASLGVRAFCTGSDQGFLRAAATRALQTCRDTTSNS
ncbi:HpcH/HpaI aldolase family protein [Chachezhania antarctica]|uniref:HpcH/HpaI aldolase family protein n=1 Tax=Chachezhania antarctica TaxID=2340860 RepID=UPI000EB06CB8|nr:aldolase/citrate lyase family protein [Chachezhania antarctica]|tara:strand:- start:1105 stop:1893 length:789 start_codon:yes stop_codon:yes gene_type:complete